jgi:hypothetical protein
MKNFLNKNLVQNFCTSVNDKINMCKYCKNRMLILDKERSYSDRCKKFILSDNKNTNVSYELAYNARKDENKCGKKGKYYEDKYFSNNN